MTLTVNNRISKSVPAVANFLSKNMRTLPAFKIGPERAYNGIVVHIDDEDAEEFIEAIEVAGYEFAIE